MQDPGLLNYHLTRPVAPFGEGFEEKKARH
jgi:hypothetical protein